MLKIITVALALGAFAVTAMTPATQAQAGCSKAPKNYIPCTVQRELPPKPHGRN
jgi:hypothetical protein